MKYKQAKYFQNSIVCMINYLHLDCHIVFVHWECRSMNLLKSGKKKRKGQKILMERETDKEKILIQRRKT